jgi:hypothetical protein
MLRLPVCLDEGQQTDQGPEIMAALPSQISGNGEESPLVPQHDPGRRVIARMLPFPHNLVDAGAF